MNLFCVYLTIYSGNKMPNLYIGSTSIRKILRNNYRGSVSSKKYKRIWNEELKNNPNKFATFILSTHKTRIDALEKEKEMQIKFNVIKSNLYINMAIAVPNGYFGMDTSKSNNPNYGGVYSKCCEAISYNKKFKGVSWEERFGILNSYNMKNNLSNKNLGSKNPMYNKVNVIYHNKIITINKNDFNPDIHKFINSGIKMSNVQKSKLSVINKGKKHTKETLIKMSLSKAGSKNPTAKKVYIDGKIFETGLDASIFFNVAKSTITYRCNSKNKKFENWYFID